MLWTFFEVEEDGDNDEIMEDVVVVVVEETEVRMVVFCFVKRLGIRNKAFRSSDSLRSNSSRRLRSSLLRILKDRRGGGRPVVDSIFLEC